MSLYRYMFAKIVITNVSQVTEVITSTKRESGYVMTA